MMTLPTDADIEASHFDDAGQFFLHLASRGEKEIIRWIILKTFTLAQIQNSELP